MKLTNPIAIKSVALVASCAIRAWMGTLDIRIGCDAPTASDPLRCNRRNIYLFWHEMFLLPAYTYARFRVPTLISRHRDGELIAQVARMLRGSVIRGSTDRGGRRGGVSALRNMMRLDRLSHLAITPDGPRGPRRVVQSGVIYLASRSARPLVPGGVAFENPWRVGSWDRMALPRPFTRGRIVIGSPIEIPPGLDRAGLEVHRLRVQKAMDEVQHRAECFADGTVAEDKSFMQPKSKMLRWPHER